MKTTVKFDLERETKGAVRYAEQAEPGEQLIGTLYFRKSGMDAMLKTNGKFPTTVSVTVEVK